MPWPAFSIVYAVAGLLGFLAVHSGTAAEEPSRIPKLPNPEQSLVYRIRWPVHVLPEKNPQAQETCAKLTPSDFLVQEEGIPGRVLAVDQDRGQTLYSFLVDNSASMTDELPNIKTAIVEFSSQLARDETVQLATFSDKLRFLCAPTRDPEVVRAAAEKIDFGANQTFLYDSLEEMLEIARSWKGRHAIVLVTDGEESSPRSVFPQHLLGIAALEKDTRVCPIVVDSQHNLRDQAPLHKMAIESAGFFSWISRGLHLLDALERLRRYLDTELLLSYEPHTLPNGDPRGKIRVKVSPREGLPCRIETSLTERFLSPHRKDLSEAPFLSRN